VNPGQEKQKQMVSSVQESNECKKMKSDTSGSAAKLER
jgi:hypothetical protein